MEEHHHNQQSEHSQSHHHHHYHHHHHHRSSIFKKVSKYKKPVITLILVVAILAGVFYGAGLLEQKYISNTKPEETGAEASTDSDKVNINGKWYVPRKNVRTILLLGVDKFSENANASSSSDSRQSDFMMLLVEDLDEEIYSMIHLNRDTMAQIPVLALNGRVAGKFNGQLTLAYAYGTGKEDSCKNACNAVSNLLLGSNIDHYISFTMDAVPILNDAIDGVTVYVEDDFSNTDPEIKQGEYVRLKGQQALTFVRSRGSMEDSSNIARMRRQKAYVLAWAEQAKKLVDNKELDYTSILKQLDGYYITDMTTAQLNDLINEISLYAQGQYYSPEGTLKAGEKYMEFYADENNISEIVLKVFYKEVDP